MKHYTVCMQSRLCLLNMKNDDTLFFGWYDELVKALWSYALSQVFFQYALKILLDSSAIYNSQSKRLSLHLFNL